MHLEYKLHNVGFQTTFPVQVELTEKIVKVTAVLHNFLRSSQKEQSLSEITT